MVYNFLYGKLLFAIFLCYIISSCSENIIFISPPYKEDPLINDQWYIKPTAKFPNFININLNNISYQGSGVLIALVDDGVDVFHEDLKNNIGTGSFNYLTSNHNFRDASHGTACAGIMVGIAGNGLGIQGIAPQAKLIAFNVLKAPALFNLIDAFTRELKRVWISNNSWGDFNSWGEPFKLRPGMEEAFQKGVAHGRVYEAKPRGIVYVFSAGNGNGIKDGIPIDNVNYSGLVNNRYTIPVCSVDYKGIKAGYSEVGATLIVCAPSKNITTNETIAITTTDASEGLGYNPNTFSNDYLNQNYTRYFGGTSASAPIVSGVVALVLQANPTLSWRDIRVLLAKNATQNDPDVDDWKTNGVGLLINHKYGFGLINADLLINSALTWKNLEEELIVSNHSELNTGIPDNDYAGISNVIKITNSISIEFIDIFFNAPDHPKLGDLEITLISPSGTKSILAEAHFQLYGVFKYENWRFGTMRHLGELSKGNWTLLVRDKVENNFGNWQSWSIKIYGTSKNLNLN